MNNQIKSSLKEVPETMLWTLHNRATEAMRDDAIIKDDKCIEIYHSIDYDYEKSFGKAEPSHAVRSLIFDKEIKAFLDEFPDGTIVNLGEGLETQRFRIKEDHAFWISVDLPESIEIREQFIEPSQRHFHSPLSVLDRSWFDLVPKDKPVFITAQGLFMYLNEKEVKAIIEDMLNSFKEGFLMFDAIPHWLSNKTMKGLKKTKDYTTPKMPWGINRNEIDKIKEWSSNITVIEEKPYEFPRGIQRWMFKTLLALPIIKYYAPTIVKIKFEQGKK